MEAREIEEAIATHYNRAWEDACDTEFDEEFDEAVEALEQARKTMEDAEKSMDYVVDEMKKAWNMVDEVAELLYDTPEGDKVASIRDDMEKTLDCLKALRDEFGKKAS